MIDILKKHFSTPTKIQTLNIISKFAWGFEGWFQIETIAALVDAGCEVTTDGKKALDADIVVNGLGIELRAYQSRIPDNNLQRAFTEHPNAGAYLFIAQDDKRISKMRENIPYPFEERELGDGWVLIYVEAEEG